MVITKVMPKVSTMAKRVAAYCRVSTLQDQQNESFETQQKYYQELIQARPEWKLFKIYADRHSATSVKNRPAFQEMLTDAENGALDVVICKSVSRFSRNIVDCQRYTKWFRTLGVTVIFEEQNIRTDDPTSDFIFAMMAALAQNESCSISRNVQTSYASRFARGEYKLGNNRILGYDCVDGVLIPNEEAWIIGEIYGRFLDGQTFREISEGLAAMGAKTKRGKNRFSIESIRYILSNETYTGDKLLQKYPPQDYLTKKPDPHRAHQPHYLTADHEAIIDREDWNGVQKILNQRAENYRIGVHQRSKEHHIFYGKVFCKMCGALFLRRTYQCKAGHYKAWICKERQKGKNGNGCKNSILKESELMKLIAAELGTAAVDVEALSQCGKILVYKDRIEIKEIR